MRDGRARSAAIGAAIAFVIYVLIALLTGQDTGPALLFGLGLAVLTFAVSFGIQTVIGSRHRS